MHMVCCGIMMSPATIDGVRTLLQDWKGIEIARQANPVCGDGNPHARMVFVGEAPGKHEDEQGKPFVGQAGKLLDALLASIDLQREDIYITNVVKFRPPDNRDPTQEEKEACLPFLQMELAIIRPEVIVPLGRHALRQFFPKLTISDAHGKAHSVGDMYIFPLYHPAAALHNPGLRKTLFADMIALKQFLDSSQRRPA